MHDSEKSKITRFVSGLRREIKNVVELNEYSSLKKLDHLTIKVESPQMMTLVGLGATCYPSPDGDTCRAGCEPRVQKHNDLEREEN